MRDMNSPVALITGGSRGLGAALSCELVRRGWRTIVDGRDRAALAAATAGVSATTAVAGDVADPAHRGALVAAVRAAGRLDLLVNNASVLGPTPLPLLVDLRPADLAEVFAVNTFAPLRLVQLLLPALERSGGRVVNLSSDAAVEAYSGWGGYGASKAALDQVSAVLAVEHPGLRIYAFDPGDMATDLARDALPGEDVTARPAPESVVPSLLRLIVEDLPSGRYLSGELAAVGALR